MFRQALNTALSYSGFAKEIGIDLGTQNTVVADPSGRVLVNEPTLVCVHTKTKNMHFGNDAMSKLGLVSKNFDFVWPLRDGKITADNEELVQRFLEHILKNKRWATKPRVVIAISCALEEKDFRNVRHVTMPTVSSLDFIYQPFGAALANGINPKEKPTIVWDMGHGTTDGVAISAEDNVLSKGWPIGGSEMNEAIIAYVLTKHGITIDHKIATEIKHSLGCAIANPENGKYRSLRSFFPKTEREEAGFKDIPITDEEICKVLSPILLQEEKYLREFFETLSTFWPSITTNISSPQLRISSDKQKADFITVLLGGGVSLLSRIDEWFADRMQIKVEIITDPLQAAAVGAAKCAADRKLLHKYLVCSGDVSERTTSLQVSDDDVKSLAKRSKSSAKLNSTTSTGASQDGRRLH